MTPLASTQFDHCVLLKYKRWRTEKDLLTSDSHKIDRFPSPVINEKKINQKSRHTSSFPNKVK
jgi:hypothetical protein